MQKFVLTMPNRLLRSLLAFSLLLVSTITLSAQCNVSAGELSLAEGGDIFFVCVDDGESDLLTPTITGAQGGNSVFVLTTAAGFIVDFPTGPNFEFEGTGQGINFLYQLTIGAGFTGDIEIGDNICLLTEDSGCFDLSNSITINRRSGAGCNDICDAVSTEIALADGTVSQTICSDGTPDPLEVVMIGDFAGDEMTFVITRDNGEILNIPEGAGPFDLDGAGPGTCIIWYIAYSSDLEGLEVGLNLDDIEGCFDLSNGITVTRQSAAAGEITLLSGAQDTTICIDGTPDPFNVLVDTLSAGEFNTFVITDQATGEILGIPTEGPFDLEGAGGGTCLIYNLSFNNLFNLEVGANIADLEGCFDLSEPIVVTRNANEGGTIAFADGSDEVTLCLGVDNTVVQASYTTDGSGETIEYFITDGDGMILGTGNTTGTFDVGPAGAGNCVIYGISYSDVDGLTMGQNIADLSGCFALSNGITTVRIANEAGTLSFEDGSDEVTLCLGVDNTVVQAIRTDDTDGETVEYFITDADGMILGAGNQTGMFDVGPAGVGSCVIYSIAYTGDVAGLEMGSNIADLDGCFDLSNGLTTIRVEGDDCDNNVDCDADGGTIALADGSDEVTLCLDTDDTVVTVTRTEQTTGTFEEYFITDANGMILATGNTDGTFDVGPAGVGSCVIYSIGYDETITGLMAGESVDSLGGCFALSNPVTTIRVDGDDCNDICDADGGMISFISGATEVTLCLDTDETVVQAVLDDTISGDITEFIITDGDGMILGTGNTDGMFDVGPAGVGSCVIYSIAYNGSITGLAAGSSIDSLGGCFDLSNGITTIRVEGEDCPDGFAPGDVFVSEVSAAGMVEIENNTDEAINVSEFRLGSQAAGFQPLSALSLECGSLNLQPGDVLAVDASSLINGTDSEVILFRNASTTVANLLSYVLYGDPQDGLFTDQAVAAGVWTEGVSLTAPVSELTLQVFVDDNGAFSYDNLLGSICKQNDEAVSTSNVELLTGVSLFPNPVENTVNLSFEALAGQNTVIQVMDMNGRRILERNLQVAAGTTTIDLPNAAAGTYLLRVINDGKVAVLRFVKN